MDKKTRIYDDLKDVHVAAVVVYAVSGNACVDSEGETKFTASELKDAYLKGAVIVEDGVNYTPASYAETEGIGTLTYIKVVSDTVTAATVDSVADPE